MTKTLKIKTSSANAKKAFEEGKAPLDFWTKEEILEAVEFVLNEYEACPEADMGKLELVDESVLQDCLLDRTEWHHINGKPVWFYAINEAVVTTLTKSEMGQMLGMTHRKAKEANTPKFVFVDQMNWVNYKGWHQKQTKTRHIGVTYDGYVYFENGQKVPLKRDVMEVAGNCKKTAKKYGKMYNRIVNSMRTNYSLAV